MDTAKGRRHRGPEQTLRPANYAIVMANGQSNSIRPSRWMTLDKYVARSRIQLSFHASNSPSIEWMSN